MSSSIPLPQGVQVIERGWLSANNILLLGEGPTTLVDSGYCTHSQQTRHLLAQALQGRPLDLLINTHLHSDHCGGNAALQDQHPHVQTLIPPGHAQQVRAWDTQALTYASTGQSCPRFHIDGVLSPGSSLTLGDQQWHVHAAPGHDTHSVVLFEPVSRTLISADALWENGFGVVFPELDGENAFDEVGLTLDLIESLEPAVIIPGHGPIFSDLAKALGLARQRLSAFIHDPAKHARHAAKVLLKFKLLELQSASEAALCDWAIATPYMNSVHRRWSPQSTASGWVKELLGELVRSGAARREGDIVFNA